MAGSCLLIALPQHRQQDLSSTVILVDVSVSTVCYLHYSDPFLHMHSRAASPNSSDLPTSCGKLRRGRLEGTNSSWSWGPTWNSVFSPPLPSLDSSHPQLTLLLVSGAHLLKYAEVWVPGHQAFLGPGMLHLLIYLYNWQGGGDQKPPSRSSGALPPQFQGQLPLSRWRFLTLPVGPWT